MLAHQSQHSISYSKLVCLTCRRGGKILLFLQQVSALGKQSQARNGETQRIALLADLGFGTSFAGTIRRQDTTLSLKSIELLHETNVGLHGLCHSMPIFCIKR